MFVEVSTLTAWPNESFRVTHSALSTTGSGPIYSIAGYTPLTIAINIDGIHNSASLNAVIVPRLTYTTGATVEAVITELAQSTLSGVPSFTIKSTTSGLYLPLNDHSTFTSRIFNKSIFTFSGTEGQQQDQLASMALTAGSAYYIIPSHLTYTDNREPSAIIASGRLDLSARLRNWEYDLFTSSTLETGQANTSPYNFAFLNYAVSPASYTPITTNQISALSAIINTPKVYRHVDVNVATTVDGASSFSNNLLSVAGASQSLGEELLPGSIVLEFSYDSPLYKDSEYTFDEIPATYGYSSGYRETLLKELSSVTVPVISSGTAFVRDIPMTGANPVSGNLVGRDPIFNEYFVNSATSVINYQTGAFALFLNTGYKLTGNALLRGFYDNKYDDFAGYPTYQVIGQSPNDHELSLIDKSVRTVGNNVFARYDVSVYNLSSIIDRNDYPTYPSTITSINAYRYASSTQIGLNALTSFSAVSSISFSSTNTPLWLFTYTSTITSNTNTSKVNGIQMVFNTLSARTVVTSNSAFITPHIVSNYGTTILPFASSDAYYGYLQFNCLGAVTKVDNRTQTPTLSVYKIESNGQLTPYEVSMNVYDITYPYELRRSANQTYQVETSAISAQTAFLSGDLSMSLRDVALFYETDASDLYDDNKIALQLYGLNTAIKTSIFDQSISFINGGAKVFINLIQQTIKELAGVSRSSISLDDFDTEIFYKLTTTGNYFKNVQTTFNEECRAYILQSTSSSTANEFKTPIESLCAELSPVLSSLAAAGSTGNDTLSFVLTNDLFSIGKLIGSTSITAEEYNVIIDLLTKSFVFAAWPAAYDVASSLTLSNPAYLGTNLNVVKLIFSLGLETVFDLYVKAFKDALRRGVITQTKYDEILKYYADQNYARFNYEISLIKTAIDYSTLIKGTLNPNYSSTNYISIAYYLATAEKELGILFEYVYAFNTNANETVFNNFFRNFNLIDNKVGMLNIRYSTGNTIYDKTIGATIEPYDGRILTLNPQTHRFTSALVPLSSKFCIITPPDSPVEVDYELKMYSQVIGCQYDDITTPIKESKTYIYKSPKLGRQLQYRADPFTVYPTAAYNSMVLNFYHTTDDDATDSVRIKALPAIEDMLASSSASACSIIWDVQFLDIDGTYVTTKFIPITAATGASNVVNMSAVPYVSFQTLPLYTNVVEYALEPTEIPNTFTRTPIVKTIASHNKTQATYANEIIIDKIGVNPITVSVSVTGASLSNYGVTNNILTGQMIYYPDLGQDNTTNLLTPQYSYSSTVVSRLSVVSYDSDIDNSLLLRNYFIKNNRIYNPPVYENTTFNVDSIRGVSLLFKCDSNGNNEQEIPLGVDNRNTAYYKVKTLMPKTLNVVAPEKDRLTIQTFHTPACIAPTQVIQLPVNYFPSQDIFYSKFNIAIAGTAGSAFYIGNIDTINTLVVLSSITQPFTAELTPLTVPQVEHGWISTSALSTTYSVASATQKLVFTSSTLSGLSAGIGTFNLSSKFTYQNGEYAILKSKPLCVYVSPQASVNELSAKVWTVNTFTNQGPSAVNTLNSITVNTQLTTVGNGHTETLVLSAFGTRYKTYAWTIGNEKEYVTNSPIASATIKGTAGTLSAISVKGYYLQLDVVPSLTALTSRADYDDNKTAYVNVKNAINLLQDRNNVIYTANSSVTSDYFKPLQFIDLATPVISAEPADVYFYSDSISSLYDAAVFTSNNKGEYVVGGTTTAYVNIRSLDTQQSITYGPIEYSLVSGFNNNTITIPDNIITDPDSYNCAVLAITSTDTIVTNAYNSVEISKTTTSTRVDTITAIKIPTFNLFWDEDYYAIGSSLTIKNYYKNTNCGGVDYGLSSISITFNGQTQVYPASTETFVFNNLNDIGVYSISVSANTYGLLSSIQTTIESKYDRAINVVNAFDTFDKNARTYNEQLIFPYSLDQIYVAPNEIANASNINSALKKLLANFDYLINKSKLNDTKLPVLFNKWLGAENSKGHRWNDVSESDWVNVFPEFDATEFHDVQDAKIYNDRLIVIDRNASNTITDNIKIYNLDRLSRKLNDTNLVGEKDYVGKLGSIAINDNGEIYITDTANHCVYVYSIEYSTGTFTFLNKIGGLGNAHRPYRFNNPTDIHYNLGKIYVIDKNNDVVKVYNDKMQYFYNISHGEWVMKNNLVSITTDTTANVYVLTTDGQIYIFNNAGEYVSTLSGIANPFAGTPVKIHANSIDDGIIYIVYNTHISKITAQGYYLGYFMPLYTPYVTQLKSICQYGRGVYIIDTRSIYKNTDFVSIKSIINDIEDALWKADDILIEEQDLIQDWVYNVVFNRIKDNFELLAKNIHSKYVRSIDLAGNISIDMEPMLTAELPQFDFSQCFIGQNELVFADVINRVIKHLYTNLDKLRVSLDTIIGSDMCKNSWCWSWASMGSYDPVKKNCIVNPISFIELRSDSPGIGGRTWEQMSSIGNGCCEVVTLSGSRIPEIHQGYMALSPNGSVLSLGGNSSILSLYSLSS